MTVVYTLTSKQIIADLSEIIMLTFQNESLCSKTTFKFGSSNLLNSYCDCVIFNLNINKHDIA